jgi:hypothetical protein
MAADRRRLAELGMATELAKELANQIDTGTLQIGTTSTTAMAGNRTPTLTIRGGVLLQAAIPSLTGTVGTANDVMTAVPDATAASTDTSAASLASTNAAILALNNNLADLQAKVNAILVAERAAGIVTP